MFMTEIFVCVCVMLCVDVGTGYAVIPQNMFIINNILVQGDLSEISVQT